MISIVTPTHKKTKLWSVTVESVMNQTYKDFEWIVLDNSKEGYFESEFEVFKKGHPEYSDVFDNVKIYHEYYEGRHPVAFYKNKCIEHTTCKPDEFVVTLDHDDLLVRTALEDFVGCSDKYGSLIDYIFGYEYVVDDDKTINIPSHLLVMPNTVKTTLPNLKFGKSDFYIDSFNVEMPEVTSIDLTSYTNQLIGSHPRVIRRYLFDRLPFKYNECDYYEDDTLQTMFAILFLNVGYICRPTVVYVRYTDEVDKNESANVRSDEDMRTHDNIHKGLCILYEAMRTVYPDNILKRPYFYYNNEDFKTSLEND